MPWYKNTTFIHNRDYEWLKNMFFSKLCLFYNTICLIKTWNALFCYSKTVSEMRTR